MLRPGVGLITFISNGNIAAVAVAVVLGAGFANVIQDFVKAFVTPWVDVIADRNSLVELHFTIRNAKFPYGYFLNSLISFFVLILAVYYVFVVPALWVVDLLRRKQEKEQRECPECLAKVPKRAKRCGHCASKLDPVDELLTENDGSLSIAFVI